MTQEIGVIELSPAELARQRENPALRLVDVRQPFEHQHERIPGSELLPLRSFDPASLAAEGENLVLYCRSGHRSAIAATSVAAVSGRPVRHLAGGILAWRAAGLPVELGSGGAR